MSRRGGLIQIQVGGVLQDAKGEFTYNLGNPVRSAVIGSDGVHGFTEEAQPAFIEGKITDRGSLDVANLQKTENATVVLVLANGKHVMLSNAWYAGEGSITTGEGEIDVRFEARSGSEVA